MEQSNLRVISFKATKNPELCSKYFNKHKQTLLAFNAANTTSLNTHWFKNDKCYCMIIEDLNTNEIIGGVRLNIKTSSHSLPVEKSGLKKVNKHIEFSYSPDKLVAETTALWIDDNYKGQGLVNVLAVGIMSIARKLKIDALIILCSRYTQKTVRDLGYKLETSLGKNGSFRYPTQNLLSFFYTQNDLDFNSAIETYQNKIKFLSSVNKYWTIETYREYRHKIIYDMSGIKSKILNFKKKSGVTNQCKDKNPNCG